MTDLHPGHILTIVSRGALATEKTKAARNQLTPRKEALLYGTSLPENIVGPTLDAVRAGLDDREAAEAGGLTPAELRYVFWLAEQGHPGYREFRDEFYRLRSEKVAEIKRAQHERAVSEDGSIADRKFALANLDRERYPEHEDRSRVGPMTVNTGDTRITVVKDWREMGPEVVDAEDAEVVE